VKADLSIPDGTVMSSRGAQQVMRVIPLTIGEIKVYALNDINVLYCYPCVKAGLLWIWYGHGHVVCKLHKNHRLELLCYTLQ
jgi:hypothetical protein